MVLPVNHSTEVPLLQALTQFGTIAGLQQPWVDSTNGKIMYFRTPKLADDSHMVDITVMTANFTSQFILDFFLVTPIAGASSSGVETSGIAPSSTPTQSTPPILATRSTPVSAIVGGVVGSIAGIVILVVILWYFLRRLRGGQGYYFEKSTPAEILADERL